MEVNDMNKEQNRDLTFGEPDDLGKTTEVDLKSNNNTLVKGLPIHFKPDFSIVTLKAIKRFNEKRDELQGMFPSISLKAVREYLRGRGDLPEDMKPIVDEMNEDRKGFIELQTSFAKEIAKEEEGISIPERYLTGEALDVFFAPEIYRFYDFAVYYYFSWYEPWEMIELLSGPLFSI